MNTKQFFSRVINILLIVLFFLMVVNSTIIHFRLVQSINDVVEFHRMIGWIFLLVMFVHILYHLRYYKLIFTSQGWQ